MSEKLTTILPDIREKIYSLTAIVQLTRVTTEFVRECERENLIEATIFQGQRGYTYETVCRMIRIRHLHQDLGLDISAVDCILRMRQQITALQRQLNEVEQRVSEREQELLNEIKKLQQRLAQVYNGKSI